MGRTLFVAGCALFVALAVWLVATDRLRSVAVLGVPVMEPSFADVRSITGARLALELGIDPLASNPGDPWQRPFDYPRAWLWPARLGVGPEHTTAVAIAMFGAFAIGLAALVPLATTPLGASLLLLLLFAPTTWLAVERANNDLAIFGLLAVAAWLAERWRRTSAGLVAAAAALKLFPIFALPACCSDPRNVRQTFLPVTLLFCGYLLWIRADLAPIRANAQTWHPISYGITLLPRAVADRLGWPAASLLGAAAVGFAVVACTAARLRTRARLGTAGSAHSLAAFRSGAGVFVGTFLLGSNFDYRMIVLLLVVPQLAAWVTTTHGLVRLATQTLLAVMVLVAWSMTWRAAVARLGIGPAPGLVVDELLTWCLACGLAVLLVATLPDWLLPVAMRGRPWLDAANASTAAMMRSATGPPMV